MLHSIKFWIMTSRPGLWFATLWLYLLPCSQMSEIWNSPAFWIGLVYVTFPLNFLIYGWNDVVDYEADQVNPRKNTFLFGARGNKDQLERLWLPILIVQLAFIPFLFYFIGIKFLWLLLGIVSINWLYNLPEKGLRNTPPLELLCQVGYLLIVPLSMYLNNTTSMSVMAFVYLVLFAMQSHLMGEVMDLEPDLKSGKRTTATVIGRRATKWLIITIVLLEIIIVSYFFKEWIFSGMLGLGFLWLLLDVLMIYRNKAYSLSEMKLFGYASNLIAITSMIYVWYSGCLHI